MVANQPQVLILCGPFVDEKHSLIEPHSLIETGYLAESFDAIFGRVMTLISEAVANISTQVNGAEFFRIPTVL